MNWRTTMLASSLVLIGALAVGTSAEAEPPRGQDVVDVNVFYDALEPYGRWVEVADYDRVWVPLRVDYRWRPYTVGRWVHTGDWGWTWVSNEPWGWATDHYGNWAYLDDYGWSWVPDTKWAPSWVAWRTVDDHIGWAPLPPDTDVVGRTVSVDLAPERWVVVPSDGFLVSNVAQRVLDPGRTATILADVDEDVIVQFEEREGGAAFANVGLDVAEVERLTNQDVRELSLETVAQTGAQGARDQVQGNQVKLHRAKLSDQAFEQNPPKTDQDANEELRKHLDQQRQRMERDMAEDKKAMEQRHAKERREAMQGQGSPGRKPDDTEVGEDRGEGMGTKPGTQDLENRHRQEAENLQKAHDEAKRIWDRRAEKWGKDATDTEGREGEQGGPADRPERPDRPDRPDRPGDGNQPDRPDHPERPDRPGQGGDAPGGGGGDAPGRGNGGGGGSSED